MQGVTKRVGRAGKSLVTTAEVGFCCYGRRTLNQIFVRCLCVHKVLWDISPCRLEVDQRFRGVYCRHHQGDETSSAKFIFET
jgi:hypothetical protein